MDDTEDRHSRTLYARPGGWHYHASRRCPMLRNGDFKRLGYVKVGRMEVRKRKLRDCACVGTLDRVLASAKFARREPS